MGVDSIVGGHVDDLVIAGMVRRRMGPLRWRPYELILDTTGGLVTITLTPRDNGLVGDTRRRAERMSGRLDRLSGKFIKGRAAKKKAKSNDGVRVFKAEHIISATLERHEVGDPVLKQRGTIQHILLDPAASAVTAVHDTVHGEKHPEFFLKVEMSGANDKSSAAAAGGGGRDSFSSVSPEMGSAAVEREYRFRVATESAAQGWVKSLNVYILAARRRELQAIIEEIKKTRRARQDAKSTTNSTTSSKSTSTSTALADSGERERTVVMQLLEGVKSLQRRATKGKGGALVMLLDVPNEGAFQRMYSSISQFIDRIWTTVWPSSPKLTITNGASTSL